MAVQRGTYEWVDVAGGTRLTTLTTSSGGSGVATALVAKSNADIAEDWEGPLQVALSPVVTAAPFQSTRDIATLFFATSASTIVKIILPAPVSSIFFGDEETVDPSQIAAIIAAVIANVVDAAGNAVTSFVAGVRSPASTP